MMKKAALLAVLALTAQACTSSSAQELRKDRDQTATSPATQKFQSHVNVLADPSMDGRVPGSDGNRRAADYIEKHFVDAGLQPPFDAALEGDPGGAKTYRQTFRAGSETKVTEGRVSWLDAGGAATVLTADTDFSVLGLSGSAAVTGPVVFVGYGIESGPAGYRGFADDADLSGKIAMVFRFEPMDAKGQSQWTQGNGWSPASSLDSKIEALAKRKAAGIILVNPPGADDPRAQRLITATDSLPFREGMKVPVVMLSAEAAERLVRAAGFAAPAEPLMRLREQADGPTAVLTSFDASAKVTLIARLERNAILTDNVGAVLPGVGELAREWVVIGAHYDHLGKGPIGARPENFGQLHPGADDNASGTTGLLMLAQRLSDAAKTMKGPRRSVLFLAFCAEESGLNGSRFYVNNPPKDIPNDAISLMINLDMIGRLRNNQLEVQGTVSGVGLYDALKETFDASGLEIKHGSTVASNSDHASFFNKNIPVLFFFTGLHRQYHTPQDTADTINAEGGAKVVDLVEQVALLAATRRERFAFDAKVKREAQASPGPMRMRVRFGIAPGTYSDDRPGVEVGDVYENTSAADAGIKTGDRMIKWNGKEIRTVEEWMPLLTQHSPGDVVDVTLIRDGKEQVVKVTLKGREGGNR